MSRVPMPAPVPPPIEWQTWKPARIKQTLSFLPDNIKNRVNQLGTLCVVSFGPIVSSSSLSKHEVIRPEDLSVRSRPHTVHCSRLQIHEHCSGDISASTGFIVVHIDPFQLKIRVTMVSSCGIDPVLITHDFPELSSNLVPTLAPLNVQNLSHSHKLVRQKQQETAALVHKIRASYLGLCPFHMKTASPTWSHLGAHIRPLGGNNSTKSNRKPLVGLRLCHLGNG